MKKTHPFLLCFDSDGTVMDTMGVKHERCFGPAFPVLTGTIVPVPLVGDVAGVTPSNIDHALLTAYDCANATK